MPTALEHIASTTISGTSTSTITFSSIPADYGHLLVYMSCANNGGGATGALQIRYNGNSSNIYGWNYWTGNADYSSFNGGSRDQTYAWALYTSNGGRPTSGGQTYWSNSQFYFAGYRRNMAMMQSITVGGAHNTTALNFQTSCHTGGSWGNTATVTSLTLISQNGSYIADSILSLYGLKIA